VLSGYYHISKRKSDDVRWERVEHIKLKLATRAYTVATEEVAAKVIEYMLNLGRAYRRKTSRPGEKTSSQSTDAAGSGTIQNGKDISGLNVRQIATDKTTVDKAVRTGTSDGFMVTGWRCLKEAKWRVRVWAVGSPKDWIGYTVAAGIFEFSTVDQTHKAAALNVIGEWETEIFGVHDRHWQVFNRSAGKESTSAERFPRQPLRWPVRPDWPE
jgi:hypothetical protein